MNSGLLTKCLAASAAILWILPLMWAAPAAGAVAACGARATVRGVSGLAVADAPSGDERPGVSPQRRNQGAAAVDKTGQDRRVVSEETFYMIVFPFFVIMFTCAAVCLYLGTIAWLPVSGGDEIGRREA